MALKTNYKDDVFTGNRKYNMITNQDGTVSFTDATSYSQSGDVFAAADANAITQAINKLNTVITVTVSNLIWSNSAPYTATVSAPGITAESNPVYDIYISENVPAEDAEEMVESFGFINKLVTGADQVTFYCYGDRPTIPMQIQLKGI